MESANLRARALRRLAVVGACLAAVVGVWFGVTFLGACSSDNGPAGKATTTLTLSSSTNPSVFGQAVSFTATVSDLGIAPVATGTVTFTIDSSMPTTASLSTNASGLTASATMTASTLSVGTHTITASYNGAAANLSNSTSTLTQTVTSADAGVPGADAGSDAAVMDAAVSDAGDATAPDASGDAATGDGSTPADAASDAASTTMTFDYTGAMQSFVVPSGVTSVTVTATGAGGGADGCFGASGGGVTVATITVTPGETLDVFVGGQGGTASTPTGGAGGYNGGGAGGIQRALGRYVGWWWWRR